MTLIKIIWIITGTLSLFAGVIGIIIPGLPTTPFILLSAALFIRSSDRLYYKIAGNSFIGSYIAGYQQKKGMTTGSKIYAIGIMWLTISISCLFFIKLPSIELIVISIGLLGTVVMGFIVPTATDPVKAKSGDENQNIKH